jgi:hypothetical protein
MACAPGRVLYTGLPMAAHNREIYRERLGLSEEALSALKAEGII